MHKYVIEFEQGKENFIARGNQLNPLVEPLVSIKNNVFQYGIRLGNNDFLLYQELLQIHCLSKYQVFILIVVLL